MVFVSVTFWQSIILCSGQKGLRDVKTITMIRSRENDPTNNCLNRTTRININRININLNDYYNPEMDYYNPVIDYYNPVIDYYNLLLRFEPCLNLLGLILILCKININLININININPT